MAIEYINKQGATVTAAAEKIKVVSQEKRARVNKFGVLRAQPVQSEAFTTGGGVYRFEQLQGMAVATRRTAAPTDSTITYGNNITLSPIVLTITEPLESNGGNGIPTSPSDVAQLDGMDFTPVAATKTMNTLVDGEVEEDAKALFTVTTQREIANTTDGDYLAFYNTIHGAIADYFDVSATNTNWTDPQAYAYFDAGRYSYEREDLTVFMNGVDASNITKALIEAGITTGDMAYNDFKEGQVRIINGIKVIETRYVPFGKVVIAPKGVIGAPDMEVMQTKIITSMSPKGDLVTYGKHYYNSTLLFGELVTIVSLGAAVVPAPKPE